MAATTLDELEDRHPEILTRYQNPQGTKRWGVLHAGDPNFRQWLLNGLVPDALQTALDSNLVLSDIDIGHSFFSDWRFQPRSLVDAEIITGLIIAGLSTQHNFCAICSNYRNQRSYKCFFRKCYVIGTESSCTNCFVMRIHGGCDAEIPAIVCLNDRCDKTGFGHEHLLRPFITERFGTDQDPEAMTLYREHWEDSILMKSSIYTSLLHEIRSSPSQISDNHARALFVDDDDCTTIRADAVLHRASGH
ncbi:hypothetical protein B0H67DRAFT_558332 [Lasiosphaeris hirsuta]|uniref:Uncharacterized protein n=1 Tax=Lasiosphaeris hirsuta TaxID=260670 RepID=A0AA39ZSA9_9PEZI|nr:hypothetical protein B0H67DRAFT_558332 [Lasiosphaeris hirsuta]